MEEKVQGIPASMLDKIDEIVRARVDAELATARKSAEVPGANPNVDLTTAAALYEKERPRMAKLVSADFISVDVVEG